MSRLHRVTGEEIAAAELRLVTDKNLGRTSHAVVARIAGMTAGDVLELPGATDHTEAHASESTSSTAGTDEPAAGVEVRELLEALSSETRRLSRLHTQLMEALEARQPSETARRALVQQRRLRQLRSDFGFSGNAQEAIAAYERFVGDLVRVLGPDDLITVEARTDLARWRIVAAQQAGDDPR